MALSDTAIRNAKAGSRPTKLSDGGGLFLLLNPNGSRWWRVQVTQVKSLRFYGAGHRYRVSWIISSPDQLNPPIASFPERVEFMSEDEASRYGENRAHTFIDSMFCRSFEALASESDAEYV